MEYLDGETLAKRPAKGRFRSIRFTILDMAEMRSKAGNQDDAG